MSEHKAWVCRDLEDIHGRVYEDVGADTKKTTSQACGGTDSCPYQITPEFRNGASDQRLSRSVVRSSLKERPSLS
jgi:hypothetical protein